MMTSNRSSNKNCAECRAPMFVWDDACLNPDARLRVDLAQVARNERYARERVLRIEARRARAEATRVAANARRRQARHDRARARAQAVIMGGGAVQHQPAVRAPPRCSCCREVGHNIRSCPVARARRVAEDARQAELRRVARQAILRQQGVGADPPALQDAGFVNGQFQP